MKRTIVISGFPGIGKTYFKNNSGRLSVLDSDSSSYSKAPDFPENYITHILENMGNVDYILVSTHILVRDALVRAGVEFVLVYPYISERDEYIKRFEKRGSNKMFIDLIYNNWHEWITEMDNQKGCGAIRLTAKQYLSDLMNVVMNDKPSVATEAK